VGVGVFANFPVFRGFGEEKIVGKGMNSLSKIMLLMKFPHSEGF